MNTGFLGPAVATVLTVYGIETPNVRLKSASALLQQYLPFTVLKPFNFLYNTVVIFVATVLTVYGIETIK